jgi:Ribosomal protein L7/L12 C-terminal domain
LEQAVDATFWLVAVLFLCVLGSLFSGIRRNDEWRLKRLERKIDLILSHLGLDPSQGVDSEIAELMKAGNKIQAIRLYREKAGVGLKEAKDYVESLR